MLSAEVLNLDQSKIMLFEKGLTLEVMRTESSSSYYKDSKTASTNLYLEILRSERKSQEMQLAQDEERSRRFSLSSLDSCPCIP